MGTFETRRHHIGNGLSVTNIGTALELLGENLPVSRNTRVSLVSIEGTVLDAEGPTAVTNAVMLSLFKGGPVVSTVGILSLEVLMSRMIGRQVAGTPANALVVSAKSEFSVDLLGKAYTQELSKGAKSNGLSGWGIAAHASSASYSIFFDISIHFIAEWINGSGSKKSQNTQFDEEENQ